MLLELSNANFEELVGDRPSNLTKKKIHHVHFMEDV